MTKTSALFAALCIWLTAGPASAGERPIVVELFTSEGCSSCPPADALLAELAGRPDVLALSFHVDYWDRLGWKDPFSSPEATARQQRYAGLLGLGTIYTPQIVVDGRWEAVGSDHAAVARALDEARHSRPEVPVSLVVENGRARITLGPGEKAGSASVLLIGFDRREVSSVERGENEGRILTHVDVVRGSSEVGHFTGGATEIEAPVRWHSDRVAAIVQAADGRILGASVRDGGLPAE
jgi:hypothetical protein